MESVTPEEFDFAKEFEPEELDPELAPYVGESSSGWRYLKHPLVFDILYAEHLNKRLNKQLAYKKRALQEAKESKEWHTYVYLHERPYRSEAFMRIMTELSDREYWTLLSSVWIDSENLHEWTEMTTRILLTMPRPGRRKYMMSASDKRLFMRMPDTITVYRGHHGHNEEGWSWTTDKRKAEFFARRLIPEDEPGYINKGRVQKSKVLAYLTDRNESEVIVDPVDVEMTTARELVFPAKKAKAEPEEIDDATHAMYDILGDEN